jgi:hypothetical protein
MGREKKGKTKNKSIKLCQIFNNKQKEKMMGKLDI